LSDSEEIQDKDLLDAGIDRNFLKGDIARLSGDDFKKAQEIRELGKKQGRDIRIRKNQDGEIFLSEGGKALMGGKVINAKGLSWEDGKDLLYDPTNLLMAVPGLGWAGKGASLFKKMMGLGKLGAAAGVTDLATTTATDIANNQGTKYAGDNIWRAATAGALTPAVALGGEKLARGAGKVFGKKNPIKDGDVPLTRGQATNNAKDLAFEGGVLKGEHGQPAQKIMQEHVNKQAEAVQLGLSKDLGATFDSPSRNNMLGEEIQENLRNSKSNDLDASNNLYKEANLDNAALSRANIQELLNNLEKTIGEQGRDSIEKFGKYAQEYEASQAVDALKKGLGVEKNTTNANPNNMSDVFKNQAGDVNIRFNDGSLNNFRYGEFGKNPATGKEYGFAGKKIEVKHPNTATADFKQQLKNARLIGYKPNGRRVYETPDGTIVAVSKDNQILTAYKPDGVRSPAEGTTLTSKEVPTTHAPSLHQGTPSVSNNIPNNPRSVNNLDNRMYPTVSLAKLEMGRKMLNEAIAKATANQDKTTLAKLMQVKSSYDKTISDMAKAGKFEGDATQVDKLLKARANKADYHSKYTNSKEENLRSAGASEVLDIINNPNKTGADINKLLDPSKTTTTKQLQALNKLEQISTPEDFNKIKEIYLNNLLSDISEKGGVGKLRGQSATDNLGRYKKLLNHLNDNFVKNPVVANKLLSKEEKNALKKHINTIEKLARTEKAKPHRSITAALAGATKGTIGRVPLVGGISVSAYENMIKPVIVRNYLNKMIKENRISLEQAQKISRDVGIILGNEKKNTKN